MGGTFGRTYSRIKSSRNINPGNEKPGNDFSSLGSDFNVTIIVLKLALGRLLTEIYITSRKMAILPEFDPEVTVIHQKIAALETADFHMRFKYALPLLNQLNFNRF